MNAIPISHLAGGARLSRRRWSARDEELLEREYGHKDVAQLARRLHRTPAAVKLKAWRMGLDVEGGEPRYSREELAEGLGVTVYRVRRWVESGQLARDPRGRFRRRDVRRFLLAHPGEISLAHVSAEWFLSLILERE